jgi:hypothetical protein
MVLYGVKLRNDTYHFNGGRFWKLNEALMIAESGGQNRRR